MNLRSLILLAATAILPLCLGACSTSDSKGSGDDAAGVGAGSGGVAAMTGTGGQVPIAGSGGQPPTATGGTGEAIGTSGTGASGSGGTSSAGTGGTAGAGGANLADAGVDSEAACLQSLKGCTMRDTAACNAFTTVDIGTLVKASELKLGPYGAIMEYNVGQGFEVPENSSESSCPTVAMIFGEPEDVTTDLSDLKDVNLSLYTVYRPACMKPEETYPVITWGNGTCGQTEGYGAMLRYIASYGYVIFASNSRYTDDGSNAMTKALDFAEAANKDATSVYYNRLDFSKVGAMGHSQGGGATVKAASDPRIKALIIWNATTSASKPFLAVSGDTDITSFTPASMASDINASDQPSAWLYYHNVPRTGNVSGHLTLMIQPERVVEIATAWWDYMLKGDAKARDFFVGADCGLCAKSSPDDFEYGEHGLQ